MGRWTATDPAREFWDVYAYASNGCNPINAFDPNGGKLEVQSDQTPEFAKTVANTREMLKSKGVMTLEEVDALPETYVIVQNFNGSFLGKKGAFTKGGRTIIWDPDYEMKTNSTGERLSPALQLVHEAGHILTGVKQTFFQFFKQLFTGQTEMNNIKNYEHPAAEKLGEGKRQNPSDASPVVKKKTK